MERKSSTEYSAVFLGKQKVQVTFKDFIFVVGSVLRTGSAQPLSSQYFAAVLISNIAGLVLSESLQRIFVWPSKVWGK